MRLQTYVLAAAALLVAGCGSGDGGNNPPAAELPTTGQTSDEGTGIGDLAGTELTVVTNDAFSSITHILDGFTEETGIQLKFAAGGDAGELVNQAILTKGDPLGDVMFGFDNAFLSRVLSEDILIPYRPNGAEAIPDDLVLDAEFRATPTSFGDVCLNYDVGWFDDAGLAVPETLEELAEPAYAGLLTVLNPATSSPGTAFMLATIAHFGEDAWLDYWQSLVDNDVEVVSGWDAAYYTSFSGSSGAGPRPLVVSYASSPPAEVIFADPPVDEAPTGVIAASCFRQIEFVGILTGSENVEAAKILIDWWISDAVQSQLPLNYFVFPANENTELPQEFIDHTVVPDEPLLVTHDDIAANRDRWINEWTSTVLR